MSKYDSLKYWGKVKARVPHRCQRCGAIVNKGEFYYKEKIDFVNPPPGFALGELCERCGEDTIRQQTGMKEDSIQPADLERVAGKANSLIEDTID